MKIIRRGPPTKAPYQFTCKGCQSVLEVTTDDGRLVYDSRDGNAYVFKCVVCQAENWINASLLEAPIRPAADDQQR